MQAECDCTRLDPSTRSVSRLETQRGCEALAPRCRRQRCKGVCSTEATDESYAALKQVRRSTFAGMIRLLAERDSGKILARPGCPDQP